MDRACAKIGRSLLAAKQSIKNWFKSQSLTDPGYRLMILTAALPMAQGVSAQSVTMPQEYAKYVGSSDTIQAFADFGDRINLRDGKLLFRTTDVELPGIGPTIRLTRSYDPDGLGTYFHETSGNAFGAWEIAVPRIRTITNQTLGVSQYSPVGWQVAGTSTQEKNARCTRFSAPDRISFPSDAARGWEAYEWWNGYHLVDDSGDDRPVMQRASTAVRSDMPLMTSDNWLIGCLPATTNGQPGEAFFAVAPDGTKYWFTELVYRQADNIEKPLWSNSQPDFGLRTTNGRSRKPTKDPVMQLVGDSDFLERAYASMLATRVEDRFGNWVTYHYTSGRLDSIDASDGRHLGISYSGTGNASVTVNSGASARTWQYAFSVGSPSSQSDQQNLTVTRPDGSKWQYALHWQVAAQMSVDEIEGGSATCPYDSVDNASYLDQTVVSPSGATLQLRATRKRFGRSYVFKECFNATGMPNSGIMKYPNEWFAYAVTSRTVTGPGLPAVTWNYSYSPASSSWYQDCATPTSCVGTVWTDTVSPDGSRQRSIFSNKFDETENKLLREEQYSTSGQLLRAKDYLYATVASANWQSNPYPWPVSVGDDMQTRTNFQTSGQWAPVRQTTITQDGVAFYSSVNSFDAFAKPLSVAKWSSLGYGKTDVTEYYDDTTRWVLGQVKRHYNSDTGLVDTRNEYDPNTALVLQTYAFEKLKATMAYNADGTLATSKDGNNNTTTFSNWKRGIPQTIQYADGASISAIVNDNGWITAVTDQNGFSTGYGYDAMGRVAAITYPNEPTFNYNARTFNFRPLTASDWLPPGVSAGQWRRYEAIGNQAVVTYYDALWRPVMTFREDVGSPQSTMSMTTQSYDNNGRVVYQSYPFNPNVSGYGVQPGTSTIYDTLGRVTQVQQDSELGTLTTTTEYLSGFQVRTTNPRGYQTTNGYQVYDQPSYEQLAWSAQPENKDVTITRNYFGLPLTIKQADHANSATSVTRSYVYDGYMQLCKTLEPETGATLMDYDAAGNLAWNASGLRGGDYDNASECPNSRSAAYGSGRRVGRNYDARNRITGLWFPDGKGSQSWTYTPDGLVATSIVDNDGPSAGSVDQAYTYNRRRLLAGESMSQRGWYSWSIGYGYDANANVAANTYPDTFNVNFTNNALGQPTQVTGNGSTLASGVSYYPNGAISQFTYGNGIVHTMSQNTRQLPARSTDAGVMDFTFNYDGNGNTTAIRDVNAAQYSYSGNRDLTYDGLDRLTQGHLYWLMIQNFHYDALDNITYKEHFNGSSSRYDNYIYNNANQLTTINSTGNYTGQTQLTYDPQGNLAGKDGQGYSFDYGNRLKSVPGVSSYRYDAQGRRVLDGAPAGNILPMYSMGGQLLFDENHRVAGTRASDYVYLSGSLLATYERNYSTGLTEFKYQHTDALGSPVAVTNQSAQVIERTNYEPYGNVIGRANNDKPGYTGHVMDSATGLTYMQQRYYDPTIGRFLSVDPIAVDTKLAGNFGRYDYANNNPYKFIDPDGRAGILYWTSPNTVVYTVRYNMHGETPQFTRAQFEAQVRADFSGSVNINGRTVTIRAQAIASNGNGPLVNNVNVVRDTAGVTTSGRSETNRIGGNQVTLGATGRDAASAATASHEVGGHGGGAGDQYAGGVAVGGNRLQSDVPGPSNVMKDLQGNPANQQTLKEIIQAPTNLNGCARGVHAATGGC